MSVSVGDLLKLPSLRRAKVLGGHRGLSKIVSSISVLESTDPGVLVDEVFPRANSSAARSSSPAFSTASAMSRSSARIYAGSQRGAR